MVIFMPKSKSHEQKQVLPQNRLQRLAFLKGCTSASTFGLAVQRAKIGISYGTAFAKWNGRAGKTQYDILLKIARFLGADSVEEVFDP